MEIPGWEGLHYSMLMCVAGLGKVIVLIVLCGDAGLGKCIVLSVLRGGCRAGKVYIIQC